MFSETVVDDTLIRHSSWVTSYNLTEASNQQFQDVFIVNDNKELYGANVESFKHFYGQRRTDDFFNVPGAGHHYIHSARTEISYSPHRPAPGAEPEFSPTTDHVAVALSRIDGYEPGCTLRAAVPSISDERPYIIDELLRIRMDLGCRVQIVYSRTYGTAVFRLLLAGVELHYAPQRPPHGPGPGPDVHSKMMVYTGRYNGWSGQKLVWGGSHNWNEVCLLRNDEVFVSISHPDIFTAYKNYFNVIWSRSYPLY
jgi:hypothetical protein